MNYNSKCAAAFLQILSSVAMVYAQAPSQIGKYDWVMPQASPAASVSQTVGVTEISITYHRPVLKGKTISTSFAPFGKVWRAGANEATMISFSTDVMIEGKPLPSGSYSLFMIPSQTDWAVVFNKVAKQWGAFTYDETKDALRVTVKPQTAEPRERLEYSFPAVDDNSAQVALQWGSMKVAFTVTVDTARQDMAKAKANFDWSAGWFASNYFFQQKTDLETALRWINASIALEANTSNLFLKAKILAGMGRYEEAVKVAEQIRVPQSPVSDQLKANIERATNEWRNELTKKPNERWE